MKPWRGRAAAIAVVALVAVLRLVGGAEAQTTPASAPTAPSARDLTRNPAIWNVSISPDGQHIAALTSPDGDTTLLSVWPTAQPGAKPFNIGATHMRFIGVRFLKNDRLLVTATQPWTYGVVSAYVVKSYITDLEGKNWVTLLPESHALQTDVDQFVDEQRDSRLIDRLPRDPQNVIVEDDRIESRGDIDKVNIYTGQVQRLEQGSERVFDYKVDLNGNLRAREIQDFDQGKLYEAQQVKDPDTGQWTELFRTYAKDREGMDIVGFTTDPHVVLVAVQTGNDKTSIYAYDIKQKKLLDQVFADKLFEAGALVQSHAKDDYGDVLGVIVRDQGDHIYWTDDRMAAIQQGVSKALGVRTTPVDWIDPGTGLRATIDVPYGASVSLDGWSDDRRSIIVEKSGAKQPPEYYLLTDGAKLSLLGRAAPWIKPETLGDTRMVEYPARDGLLIPAFLTTPPASFGPGPYPTLIEPHGGPWARDDIDDDYGGWIQYFASRGFAVLRPQFRGSEGWGQKLWRAGDAEWGQTMQDDLDDGVKWMIGQHVADPKRVAMFGYSYGGYAALVAAIRPNGLYQCSISGAGAGDLASLEEATFDNRYEREFQHPTIKGLDALAHAHEAQIPVLLYHGDRDRTVDIEQSRKFAAALGSKPHKFVEIKDMGHQLTFMTPAMEEEQLNLVDGFLKTDCKPGGL